MEILKAIWADPTAHQLVVSAFIAVLGIVGVKMGGTVGKIVTWVTDLFGSNIKH